jgi:hypothetical protein
MDPLPGKMLMRVLELLRSCGLPVVPRSGRLERDTMSLFPPRPSPLLGREVARSFAPGSKRPTR